MTRQLVIDACCTLNVLATRLDLEIIQACDLSLIISDHAHNEALFLYGAPDDKGIRSKELASTERLQTAGRLAIRKLDTGELVDAFVQGAEQLRDQDASCVALAGVLGLPLMTDDGKEQRVARELFPMIEIISTLAVIEEAVRKLALSEEAQLRLAANLRSQGNFAPPRKDRLAGWYAELLRKAGVPT